MLMYTVSLELQMPSCVTIHNQCLNTKLVSPIYFGNDTICLKLSNQQIDIGAKMSVSFEIKTAQDDFEGALLYKLQRHPDSQYDMDTSTTETNKNEAMDVHMLVAWKVKNSKLFAYVTLVEHTKEFTWNEDKLKKLYDKNHDHLKEYGSTISDAWLMNDDMVLKTTFSANDLKGNLKLGISTSEAKDNYAIRPSYINLER
jgi:hypothetical protein